VYGVMDGFESKQPITAKLPPAHVREESIRPGEWHPFAVRTEALREFDKDGKRLNHH
jgi:multiple sugar transport system ATP-binding protein